MLVKAMSLYMAWVGIDWACSVSEMEALSIYWSLGIEEMVWQQDAFQAL